MLMTVFFLVVGMEIRREMHNGALANVRQATLPMILVPMAIASASTAVILPNSAVGALSRHSGQAGSASALLGTLQFGIAGCSGILLAWMADGTARPMAMLMVASAAATVLAERLRPRT